MRDKGFNSQLLDIRNDVNDLFIELSNVSK